MGDTRGRARQVGERSGSRGSGGPSPVSYSLSELSAVAGEFRAAEGVEEEVQRLRREVAQLKRALETRPVIDQARGVLMATGPCTAAEAWDVLRDASQHSNLKMRTIAQHVIAGSQGAVLDGPAGTALRRALWRIRNSGRPAGS
ncbi:ANTAR domain-containing response regulator [Streptomyces sp. bgisy100]|uniref:ANTAR domain-containing response regulator n=1 Tax=Streptomyces sp. bgisy100 TaxID=3413783 RepID=UPI003D75EFF3